MSTGPWEDGKTKGAEVRRRLKLGERPTDIVAAVGCSLSLVSGIKREMTRAGQLSGDFGTSTEQTQEKLEQATLAGIDESNDLEWLRAVRNNPKVLWGDRIRASIAASKLEGAQTEDAWAPPTGDAWRDLLRDLIASQSPEDRESIRTVLI